MTPTAPSEVLNRTERFFRTRRPEGVASAYVFGSRARREVHRESDLNVGVIFDRGSLPDRGDRAAEAIDLASALIGEVHMNDVQVVSLIDVSPELASAALREGRRLYRASPKADRRERRRIFLRTADLAPFLRRTRERKLRVLRR